MDLTNLKNEIKYLSIGEITEMIEELNETIKNKRIHSGYGKVGKGNPFYFVALGYYGGFTLDDAYDSGSENGEDSQADDLYREANYFADSQLAKDRARFFNLYNQLTRFKAENEPKQEYNYEYSMYFISYSYGDDGIDKGLYVDCAVMGSSYDRRDFGMIYFDTSECAEQAISKFKDELIWYFTEYKDRL